MARKPITDLTQITSPSALDLLYMVANPATAAVDRKVQLADLFKLQHHDIRAYGAVADWNGSTGTDNQSSIQAALDASYASGGVVYIPVGNWRIGSELKVYNGNNLMGGAGIAGRSTKGARIVNTGTGHAIHLCDDHGEPRNSVITNLRVDGNASGLDGLFFDDSLSHCQVQNVYLYGHRRGIDIGNFNFLHVFINVWVDYSTADGIYCAPANSCNGLTFMDVWSAYSAGDGWHLTNQAGINLNGVYADANTGDGFDLTSVNGTMTSPTCESNVGDSMRFYDCPLVLIRPRVTGAGSGTGYGYRIVGGNSPMIFIMPQTLQTRAANSVVIGDTSTYHHLFLFPLLDKAADYNGRAIVYNTAGYMQLPSATEPAGIASLTSVWANGSDLLYRIGTGAVRTLNYT